jgi:hypothetical protein
VRQRDSATNQAMKMASGTITLISSRSDNIESPHP